LRDTEDQNIVEKGEEVKGKERKGKEINTEKRWA
jgi:hypothetical protein